MPSRPSGSRRSGAGETPASWTFLTNHAHVLLCIAEDPAARMRDLAEKVGITERAVHRIVDDLEQAGYVSRSREGRRNHYAVHGEVPLRHPVERHRTAASLIALVEPARKRRPR